MRLLNPIKMCSSGAQQCLASYSCSSRTAKSSYWNGLCFGWTLCRMQREERGQSNRWLNCKVLAYGQRGRITKLSPAWEGIGMGGCCAYLRSICWWGRVACETSLFFSLKRKILCHWKHHEAEGIRMFLMIMLIHLIAYKTAMNQRLWHGKYHKSLWYAQIKGIVICAYLYTHRSIHTCTLCVFLKCFWTIILCMAVGEQF